MGLRTRISQFDSTCRIQRSIIAPSLSVEFSGFCGASQVSSLGHYGLANQPVSTHFTEKGHLKDVSEKVSTGTSLACILYKVNIMIQLTVLILLPDFIASHHQSQYYGGCIQDQGTCSDNGAYMG